MTEKENPIPEVITKEKLTLAESLGTDLAKLPSRGKLYTPDHPLHDKTEVEIKYMTANEEDILTSPALIKRGTVFTSLLKSCLVDKTIDPDTLLICDRNAILMVLRCTGYGSSYAVSIKCASADCGETFKHSFDINKLPIKYLDDGDIENEFQNSFSVKLPISGKTVCFKLMDAASDKEIDDMEEQAKRAMPDVMVEKRITNRLIGQTISVDGVTDGSEITKFATKMRAGDSFALRKRIKEVRPGVIMEQEATCSRCGESSTFDIPITPNFFWPEF